MMLLRARAVPLSWRCVRSWAAWFPCGHGGVSLQYSLSVTRCSLLRDQTASRDAKASITSAGLDMSKYKYNALFMANKKPVIVSLHVPFYWAVGRTIPHASPQPSHKPLHRDYFALFDLG